MHAVALRPWVRVVATSVPTVVLTAAAVNAVDALPATP